MKLRHLLVIPAHCFALLLFAAPATAVAVTTYTVSADFGTAVSSLALLGIEDFESSTLAPGSLMFVSDPLQPGIAKSVFPNGTNVVLGMSVQANTLGSSPVSPSPRLAGDALATASAGWIGTPTDQISTNHAGDSIDLIFSTAVKAVGLAPLFFNFNANSATDIPGTIRYEVFNSANVSLTSGTLANVDYSQNAFLGFATTGLDDIARINLFAVKALPNDELYVGVDDIRVYTAVPVPAAAWLFVSALGLSGFRRPSGSLVRPVCAEAGLLKKRLR
jgi:hypothetical protein